MHGAGNDYIYIDTFQSPIVNPSELAILLSRPHTGIGSDGLVLIGASSIADFSMRIFNADGSEAMMCGNASRCIGKYLYEKKLTTKRVITLETLSGIKTLHLDVLDGKVKSVTVDMGKPSDIHYVDLGLSINYPAGVAVSMGNPHLVIFVNDISSVDLPVIGPILEHHPLFPNRVNVEFAQIISTGNIHMRVWERGSGITMACGTGACATAVAAFFTNKSGRSSEIIMDGGALTIEWKTEDNHVYMSGSATHVFDGVVNVDQ